jgi:hypothetical protein
MKLIFLKSVFLFEFLIVSLLAAIDRKQLFMQHEQFKNVNGPNTLHSKTSTPRDDNVRGDEGNEGSNRGGDTIGYNTNTRTSGRHVRLEGDNVAFNGSRFLRIEAMDGKQQKVIRAFGIGCKNPRDSDYFSDRSATKAGINYSTAELDNTAVVSSIKGSPCEQNNGDRRNNKPTVHTGYFKESEEGNFTSAASSTSNSGSSGHIKENKESLDDHSGGRNSASGFSTNSARGGTTFNDGTKLHTGSEKEPTSVSGSSFQEGLTSSNSKTEEKSRLFTISQNNFGFQFDFEGSTNSSLIDSATDRKNGWNTSIGHFSNQQEGSSHHDQRKSKAELHEVGRVCNPHISTEMVREGTSETYPVIQQSLLQSTAGFSPVGPDYHSETISTHSGHRLKRRKPSSSLSQESEIENNPV